MTMIPPYEPTKEERTLKMIEEIHSQVCKPSTIELKGYSLCKFDESSIYIEKDDGEGMQLRIDEKWWKDNF